MSYASLVVGRKFIEIGIKFHGNLLGRFRGHSEDVLVVIPNKYCNLRKIKVGCFG